MSSAVFSTNRLGLSTPVLIALVTLRGYQDFKDGNPVYIEDLAGYLAYLKAHGIDTSHITLSRSLDKYWSEDVAEFVSEGLVFGFLTHRSPLKFDKRCLDVCKNALESVGDDQELLEEISRASKELELETLESLYSR